MNATELPSLTLEITKGPRAGDTLAYHPITDPIVRIGRVVRGNTLAIKDVGISSKHLTLQFHPDSGKWILTDLDSSNGTFVNGSTMGIEPGKGYVVGDGDRVKIGESTDFVCRVCGVCGGGGGGGETGLGLRRNPRRRGNWGEGKDGVRILGEIGHGNGGGEEGGVLAEKRPAVRRRGLRKDGEVSKEVEAGCQREAKGKENWAVVGVAESRKVGRLKKEENLVESEMKRAEDPPAVAFEESKRRGRRKDEVLKGIVVKSELLEEPTEVERVVQVVENVAVGARASTRRTRGRLNKEEQLLDKVWGDFGLEHGDNRVISTKTRTGLRSRRMNVRAAEESEKLGVMEVVDEGVNENKENKAFLNSVQVGEVKRARDMPEGNQDSSNVDEEKECVDPRIEKESNGCDNPRIEKESTGCDNPDFRNGTGSEAKGDAMRTEQMPDLSKITVREWLDWLEENLPKQIIAETEKLIAEMRSKAQRVMEYRAEQMKKREVK